MAKETTDSKFDSDVLSSKKPVLVDFWAPWCVPCKQLTPIIDQVSEEMSDKLDIYKVNIDDNPETPSKFMVRGIPTLILFKDGKVIDTKVGSLSKSALSDWIKNNL